MSSLPDTSSKLRYCIQKIEAHHKGQKLKSKICARLSVDGCVVHELPFIEEGQPLVWEEPLEGLGTSSSVFGFQLYIPTRSVFTARLKNIERNQLEFPASEVPSRIGHPVSIVIVREGEVYSIRFTFLISTVGDLSDTSPEAGKGSLQRLRRSQAALDTTLSVGKAISVLCPNITGSVLSLCEAAYKVLEERSDCDREVEELLVPFANILGTLPLVSSKLDGFPDLERTLGGVLELIRGISEHVLALGSEPTKLKPSPIPEVESNSFTDRLRVLRVSMDTWVEQRRTELGTETILDKLKPVHRSTHHSNLKCLPGTRVNVIADATAWATQGSAGSQLLWIHGLAGAGKTCIAASICKSLDARNMLKAEFFCKWDNPDLRDPREVIRSITYGLAARSNQYAQLVASTLATAPDLPSLPVRALYACLIGTPILTATDLEPILGLEAGCIVVDALDECGTETTRRTLLSCLFEITQLAPRLKVIVTSRLDTIVQSFMSRVPEGFASVTDLSVYDAEGDVRSFVRQRLNCSGQQDNQPGAQPDGHLVSALVENARGVFLWADVACRFLRNGLGSWSDLASMLMHPEVATSSSNASLDHLYLAIMAHAATKLGEKDLANLKSWLSVVAITGNYAPSLGSSIRSFLDPEAVDSTPQVILEPLSPILHKQPSSDNKEATYAVCRSFIDYITTPARSGDLCLDLTQAHSRLSASCLKTMLTELRFNICRLETSYRRNCDVPSLDARIQATIDFKLGYSCQHWIDHVTSIDSTQVDMGLLRTFLSGSSLLYWIEALSLLGRLDVALSTLSRLMKWLWFQRTPNITCVLELVNDAYGLVFGYYDTISESTPHLYVTALAMAPVRPAIAQLKQTWFPNTLKLAQGRPQHWSSCSKSPILCVTLSASQTIAASGSRDGSMCLWNTATGKVIQGNYASHSDSVLCVALCPADRLLASGAHDGTIHVQAVGTDQSTHIPLLGHAGPVLCACFSTDGLLLASGSHDRSIRIWDVAIGRSTYAPFTGHNGPVLSIRFSPDRRSVVSGSTDKTARVWTLATGESVALVGHNNWVQCVAFSSDSQHVATGGYDRSVRVWETKAGKRACEPIVDHPGPIYHVAFLRDNQCIVSFSSNCQMRIWELTPDGVPVRPRLDDGIKDLPVVYLCGGIYLASGTCVGTLRLWSGEVGTAAPAPLSGHSSAVNSVAFSPDGRRIVSGSDDKSVRLWDAETGTPASAPLVGHLDTVWSVGFSPDGRRIISGSDDKSVRLWDAEIGTPASTPLVGHSGWVRSIAFSPDGRRIVSGSGDRTVQLWDAETRTPASTPFVGHSGWVLSVAFSPDGRHIVSGSDDKTVRLWDVETGTPASTPFVGHSGGVTSVAFSPDGRRIVSGSGDKTVRLWDAESGTPASTPLIGHSGCVWSVAFSPDGQRIVSGSEDHTIRIWAADINTISLGLPADSSGFSPFLQSDGWVSTPDHPWLFWLPSEYRRPEPEERDDSLICIGQGPGAEPNPLRVTIDYSRFVHGTLWALVAAESN